MKVLGQEFLNNRDEEPQTEDVLEAFLKERLLKELQYQEDIAYLRLHSLLTIHREFRGYFTLNDIVATIIDLDKERGKNKE